MRCQPVNVRSSIFCEFTAFASRRLALSARGSLFLSCRFPQIPDTEGLDEDDGVEYDFRWSKMYEN